MASAVFIPNSTSLTIMKLVHGYFSATRKAHTLMSQEWILEHLQKFHGLKISRSTLNYNLRILREQGLISTITRHKRDMKTGKFICQVTLYQANALLKKFFSKLAAYFKRCKWVPDFRQLTLGFVPAVGALTSREEVFWEYRRQVAKKKKKGS